MNLWLNQLSFSAHVLGSLLTNHAWFSGWNTHACFHTFFLQINCNLCFLSIDNRSFPLYLSFFHSSTDKLMYMWTQGSHLHILFSASASPTIYSNFYSFVECQTDGVIFLSLVYHSRIGYYQVLQSQIHCMVRYSTD